MFKLSVLQRMTITAMMLTFYFICTRYVMIQVTYQVRLSAGVAILIFSSILLGPISGAFIGGLGDVLGALISPYAGLTINPFMVICYTLMGAVPGLIMILFKKIKGKDLIYSISFFTLLTVIFISLTTVTALSNTVTLFEREFTISIAAKILIPFIALILLGGFSYFTYFLNNKFKSRRIENPNLPSPYQISFIVVIIEVVFTLFINVFAKALYMDVAFEVVFLPSLFVAFIYLPANTLIVTYLSYLAVKTVRVRE